MPIKKILLILCAELSFAACEILFKNGNDFIEVAPSATLTFEC